MIGDVRYPKALRYLNSQRGRFVMGQALHIASAKVAGLGDSATAEEMEYLIDVLFPHYAMYMELSALHRPVPMMVTTSMNS